MVAEGAVVFEGDETWALLEKGEVEKLQENEQGQDPIMCRAVPQRSYTTAEAHQVALKEVARLRVDTAPVLPYRPFSELVRNVASDYHPNLGWDVGAFVVMRAALEAHLVALFELALRYALHANRQIVECEDMALAHNVIRAQAAE